MLLRNLCFGGLALLCGSQGLAQGDVNEATTRLAGSKEKNWVYERFEKYLGGNRCKKGESWMFYRDGRLVIKKCENEKVVSITKRWSLSVKTPLDVVVKVDNTEYFFIYSANTSSAKRQEMRLRLKPETKTTETKDLIFRYEIE